MFFFSCIDNPKKKNESCISNELLQCIKEYIKENEYKIARYNEAHKLLHDIYYSLFFFNEDTIKYFTMWESFIPANRLNISIDNPLFDTNYLCYNVLERYIFIFNNTGDVNNILFVACNENVLLGQKKKNIDISSILIYDGSFYPITYKYYKKDDDIVIERLDTALLYFAPGWIEYESSYK
jgi:hypothetical protein